MINIFRAVYAPLRSTILRVPVANISKGCILRADDKKSQDELKTDGVETGESKPAVKEDKNITELKKNEPLGEIIAIDIDLPRLFRDKKFAMDFDSPFLSHEDKYGPEPKREEPPKSGVDDKVPVANISKGCILRVDDKKSLDEPKIDEVETGESKPAIKEEKNTTELKKNEPLGEMIVIDIDLPRLFRDEKFAEAFDSPFLSHEDKYGPEPTRGEPPKPGVDDKVPVANISKGCILRVDDKKSPDEPKTDEVETGESKPAIKEDKNTTELKKNEPLGEIIVIDIDLPRLFRDKKFAMDFDSPFLSHEDKYGPEPTRGEPPKSGADDKVDKNVRIISEKLKKNVSDDEK